MRFELTAFRLWYWHAPTAPQGRLRGLSEITLTYITGIIGCNSFNFDSAMVPPFRSHRAPCNGDNHHHIVFHHISSYLSSHLFRSHRAPWQWQWWSSSYCLSSIIIFIITLISHIHVSAWCSYPSFILIKSLSSYNQHIIRRKSSAYYHHIVIISTSSASFQIPPWRVHGCRHPLWEEQWTPP